jgi:hypothetical protein
MATDRKREPEHSPLEALLTQIERELKYMRWIVNTIDASNYGQHAERYKKWLVYINRLFAQAQQEAAIVNKPESQEKLSEVRKGLNKLNKIAIDREAQPDINKKVILEEAVKEILREMRKNYPIEIIFTEPVIAREPIHFEDKDELKRQAKKLD